MRKVAALLTLMVLVFGAWQMEVFAANQLDYGSEPIVDSDLDGLTDLGELNNFNTDMDNGDSDGDGFFDGVEVQFNSDPNDILSTPANAFEVKQFYSESEIKEVPWAWYISRASALVGFALLYISILFGLTIRMPFVQRILPTGSAMRVHCWISLHALMFALFHGVALIFDKFINFSLVDVFVPFASGYQTNLVALGVISLYIMTLLVITSYGRRFISQKTWRILHFGNIILYAASFVHAFYIGTDLKNQNARYLFIFVNIFLMLVIVGHVISRIMTAVKIKKAGI